MKIVVTGATSFIGMNVTAHLLSLGHTVYAVMRPASVNLEKLNKRIRQDISGAQTGETGKPGNLIRIPLCMEELHQIREQIEETCDTFLHFAWDGPGSENRQNREIQQKNVGDSLKALEGAKALGCKRFLFAGSQAEYGIYHHIVREEEPCCPLSEYGKAKVDFCGKAKLLCGDMEYIHARIFSVYGTGDHAGSLVESCLAACRKSEDLILGACSQLWNYIYIDDLAAALSALIFADGAVDGVYNVAHNASENRPLRAYVEQIQQICGGGGQFIFGERPPHAEGMANLMPSIEKLCRVTGWRPAVSFEEGIKRMIRGMEVN